MFSVCVMNSVLRTKGLVGKRLFHLSGYCFSQSKHYVVNFRTLSEESHEASPKMTRDLLEFF